MISGAIIGNRELVASLRQFPGALRGEVDPTVMRLGYALQANVQRNQLSGQMYKVRTGRLRASVAQGAADSRSRFESTPTSSMYFVGTNVKYAAPLFLGRAAYDVVPVKAKALRFTVGDQVLFRKRVHIPARPGQDPLTTELEHMRPTIVGELGAALERAMRQAVGQ